MREVLERRIRVGRELLRRILLLDAEEPLRSRDVPPFEDLLKKQIEMRRTYFQITCSLTCAGQLSEPSLRSGPRGQALDALLIRCALQQSVHIDARSVDAIGIEFAYGHDLFDFGYGDLGR